MVLTFSILSFECIALNCALYVMFWKSRRKSRYILLCRPKYCISATKIMDPAKISTAKWSRENYAKL